MIRRSVNNVGILSNTGKEGRCLGSVVPENLTSVLTSPNLTLSLSENRLLFTLLPSCQFLAMLRKCPSSHASEHCPRPDSGPGSPQDPRPYQSSPAAQGAGSLCHTCSLSLALAFPLPSPGTEVSLNRRVITSVLPTLDSVGTTRADVQ